MVWKTWLVVRYQTPDSFMLLSWWIEVAFSMWLWKMSLGTGWKSRDDIGRFICKQFYALFEVDLIALCPCLHEQIQPGITYFEIESILRLIISGRVSQAINVTFLVLILKVNQILCFNYIRLSSFYNTFYKIVSKILGLKLMSLMPRLIVPNQVAFILDRWIHKNFIFVNEIIHFMQKKKKTMVSWI